MRQEMTKKEVEYLSLSRDTTETDLKQRREIKSGTAFHVDQVRIRFLFVNRVALHVTPMPPEHFVMLIHECMYTIAKMSTNSCL